MPTEKITKLLEINVNSQNAIKSVADYEMQIQKVKQRQEQLRKELKALRDEQAEDVKKWQDAGASVELVSAIEKTHEERIKQKTEAIIAQKAVLGQLKKEQGVVEKQLRQNVIAENAEEESLVALRAQLSNLTALYDALSRDDRLGETGESLKAQINEVTEKLKESEEATQRFYRNVGNYRNSIIAAFDAMDEAIEKDKAKLEELKNAEGDHAQEIDELTKKIELNTAVNENAKKMNDRLLASIIPFGDKILPMLAGGLNGVKNAFAVATTGAKLFARQLLALMANPIVAFLGLVAAAIAVVVRGIKGSEDNMTKWNKVIAPVNRALAAMEGVLQKVCGWILNIVAAGDAMLMFFMKLGEAAFAGTAIGDAFASANKATEEAIRLEQEKADVAKKARENEVQNAKDALEISRLRAEANDKENKTIEERIAANKRAQELEQAQADRNVELAERRLRILQTESEWADNDAATNEKLAQAEAEVYRARKEQYDKQRELMGQEMAMRQQMAADEKARRDKAKQDAEKAAAEAKARADAERNAVREAEDAMLELVTDTAAKREQAIRQSYDREIEDLRRRLDEEKNLTAAARDAINETIKAKEQQRARDLAALQAEISAERIAARQQEIALELEAVRKGTEAEFELRRQQNELALQADLAETETAITNAEERERRKQLIREKYAAMERDLFNEQQQAQAEAEKQAIENRFAELMMQAENNSVEQANIELDRRRTELEALHQMEGESDDAFRARELAAQKAYNDAKKVLTEQENKVTEGRLQIAESVTSGIAGALNALGEQNKAFAKASKVLALAEVAINTGKAIAAGTAQAQSVPFPANLGAIATTIATILSNIATAISTIKSAHFATGGKVTGAGTGTSDSIPAMLSNGEYVMTASATDLFEPVLAAMNAIGRGVRPQVSAGLTMQAASPESVTDAIAAGVRDIHPVVSVEDINAGQARVAVIEKLDTL